MDITALITNVAILFIMMVGSNIMVKKMLSKVGK